MVKFYKILNHRADLKIKVCGKTKEKLFENSMIAMLKIAKYQPETKAQKVKTKIKIKSFDSNSLLIDFLNETLYLIETKKLTFQKVEFKKLAENAIEAYLIGKPLKKIGTQIKGVSYHDLNLQKEKNRTWTATILFDI